MPDHVHILVSTLICMMAFTSKASGEFKSAAFFMCKVKSDRNRWNKNIYKNFEL